MSASKNPALLALVIGAGLFLASRKAGATTVPTLPLEPGGDVGVTLPWFPDAGEWGDWYDGDPYNPGGDFVADTPAQARLGAFLYMIQCAEIGEEKTNQGLSYSTYYGGSLFSDFSDHPILTGEKVGVPLPAEWCRKAGFAPGCVTTAAGAYQITRTTWDEIRQAGAWGPRLPDFSPESQDEGARRVLILAGALPLVESGDFDGALRLAAKRWASLPGSTAGQGGSSYARVRGFYEDAMPRGFA